jgi:cytidylate kinase
MIITIDGPAGSGKSTIAKRLANKLAFTYFETGAMYRAVTYGMIKDHIDPDDLGAVKDYLDQFQLKIRSIMGVKHYFIGTLDVTEQLRNSDVTKLVSKVSALEEVRKKMVHIQRALAKNVNAVIEGRDIGSVVFPDAELKIFLTASPRVRAERRYEELKALPGNENLSIETVLEEIVNRDNFDSQRAISPLVKAEDAIEVDTSNLSIQEVIIKIQEHSDIKNKNCKIT